MRAAKQTKDGGGERGGYLWGSGVTRQASKRAKRKHGAIEGGVTVWLTRAKLSREQTVECKRSP